MASEKLCVSKDEIKRYDAEFEHINITLQAMNIQHKLHYRTIVNLIGRMDAVEKVLSENIDEVDDKDENESGDEHSECSGCKEESLSLKEIQDCIKDLKSIFVACEKEKK